MFPQSPPSIYPFPLKINATTMISGDPGLLLWGVRWSKGTLQPLRNFLVFDKDQIPKASAGFYPEVTVKSPWFLP